MGQCNFSRFADSQAFLPALLSLLLHILLQILLEGKELEWLHTISSLK